MTIISGRIGINDFVKTTLKDQKTSLIDQIKHKLPDCELKEQIYRVKARHEEDCFLLSMSPKDAEIILKEVKGNDQISQVLRDEADYVIKASKDADKILNGIVDRFRKNGFEVKGPISSPGGFVSYQFDKGGKSYFVDCDQKVSAFSGGLLAQPITSSQISPATQVAQKDLDFVNSEIKTVAKELGVDIVDRAVAPNLVGFTTRT